MYEELDWIIGTYVAKHITNELQVCKQKETNNVMQIQHQSQRKLVCILGNAILNQSVLPDHSAG